MALSTQDFLRSLIRNVTDYYTVSHSTDTDLYQILRMYATELSSGSLAIETVRKNAFVINCEPLKLYDNFGTFFDATKGSDQAHLDDRYLSSIPSVAKNSQPAIFEDVTEFSPSANWITRATFPTSWHWVGIKSVLGSILLGKGLSEAIFWSGSFWAPAMVSSGRFGTQNYSNNPGLLIRYSPQILGNAAWEIWGNYSPIQFAEQGGLRSSYVLPFALCTYPKYLSRLQYSEGSLCYALVNSNDASTPPPLPGAAAVAPSGLTPTLTWTEVSLHSPHVSTTAGTGLTGVNRTLMYLSPGPHPRDGVTISNDAGYTTKTRAVTLHDKIYFGFSGIEYPAAKLFNTVRKTLNAASAATVSPQGFPATTVPVKYPLFPWYSAKSTLPMPFLFEYTPATGDVREVGLTKYISSGSLGRGPIIANGSGNGTYENGWRVNAIATYDNRVYLDYTSGSAYSRLGQYKHYLAAYDGISWSGSTVGNTITLTAPSGSTLDLIQWRESFYAISQRAHNKYAIAKGIRGLESHANMEGQWKFNQNLSDSTANNRSLTGVGLETVDYVKGIADAGLTAISAVGATSKGAKIPAASATAFNMGSTSFTIEVVVKIPDVTTVATGIVHKWNGTNAGYRLGVQYSSTNMALVGRVRLQVGDGSASVTVNGNRRIDDGKWHYIAVTINRSSNIASIYIDGDFDKSASISAVSGNITANSNDLEFLKTTSGQFPGILDEVAIIKASLTAAQIYSRHANLRNRNMEWSTIHNVTVPLRQFFVADDRLLVSTGSGGTYIYLDPTTSTWTDHSIAPSLSVGGHSQILSSPSGGYYGIGDSHYDYTPSLFSSATYRYVYPPAVAQVSATSSTSIPGYRKQLDFLMQAAVKGSTRDGIEDVVKAFTLITPVIAETTLGAGWKLSIFSGSISASPTDWQFSGQYGTLRKDKWYGAILSVTSGSTESTKSSVDYLVTSNTASNKVLVAPLHDPNLLWDLRRLEK